MILFVTMFISTDSSVSASLSLRKHNELSTIFDCREHDASTRARPKGRSNGTRGIDADQTSIGGSLREIRLPRSLATICELERPHAFR